MELTTHQKLIETINLLDKDTVDFFQELFDDLPEDVESVNEMENVCINKREELGVSQEFFEKLVMFYFGFDQALDND